MTVLIIINSELPTTVLFGSMSESGTIVCRMSVLAPLNMALGRYLLSGYLDP